MYVHALTQVVHYVHIQDQHKPITNRTFNSKDCICSILHIMKYVLTVLRLHQHIQCISLTLQ